MANRRSTASKAAPPAKVSKTASPAVQEVSAPDVRRDPPPVWRDPWAWCAALSVLPALYGARGAALCEPVADDLRFLDYAFFSPHFSLLDRGGLAYYWRPLARQVYYWLLGPAMFTAPGWVAAFHVLLLAATTVLLYRVLRLRWPGSWAAAAATFPMILAPVRMLITWPSNFQDLGALFFAALALHETAYRRLPTALLALLGSLLSKELAVVTALLMPWMPAHEPGSLRRRVQWTAAAGAVVALWGAAYWYVWQRSVEMFPRDTGLNQAELAKPWLLRFGWVLKNAVMDAFNLTVAAPPWPAIATAGLVAIGVAAAAIMATSPAARARLRRTGPWVLWGLLWFFGILATLPETFPNWAPYRIIFSLIGLGVAFTVVLAAAHPALLALIFVVRLAAFGANPGSPEAVSVTPQYIEFGFDFPRLARHQLILRETRQLLRARFPTLPHGARVVPHNLPLMLGDAFDGSRAFQAWYRDSTLRWLSFLDFRANPGQDVAAIVEYQLYMKPQMALVEPDAMRSMLVGVDNMGRGELHQALADFARADSIQRDSTARVFLGIIAAKRALCLAELRQDQDAEDEAWRALRVWPENNDSRYLIARYLMRRGQLLEAEAQLDTLLGIYPADAGAAALLDTVRAARGRPAGARN